MLVRITCQNLKILNIPPHVHPPVPTPYPKPVIVYIVELPGGRTLRQQKREPRVERDSPGFKQLHATLRRLELEGDHVRIYELHRPA